MAYYENLPIYKTSMTLAVFIEKSVHGFPRYHKYAIGAELRAVSKELVALIIKAHSRSDNIGIIEELRDTAERLKTNLLIGKEIRAFRSFKQFQEAAALSVSICRQAEGWLKGRRGKKA
jgi:hypothetical protein